MNQVSVYAPGAIAPFPPKLPLRAVDEVAVDHATRAFFGCGSSNPLVWSRCERLENLRFDVFVGFEVFFYRPLAAHHLLD